MARSMTLTAALLAAGGLVLGMSATAQAQAGQMICGERVEIVNALESGHQEQKTAAGLSGSGGLVELFTGDRGTWTLLLTLPGGPTCLLGAGEAWEGWSADRNGNDTVPRNTAMPAPQEDLI